MNSTRIGGLDVWRRQTRAWNQHLDLFYILKRRRCGQRATASMVTSYYEIHVRNSPRPAGSPGRLPLAIFIIIYGSLGTRLYRPCAHARVNARTGSWGRATRCTQPTHVPGPSRATLRKTAKSAGDCFVI